MNDFYIHRLGEDPWFALAEIALLEAIGLYVWRFRREPGALPLIGFQLGKAAWLLGLLVAGSVLQASTKMVWMDIASLSAFALGYAGFRFLVELWGVGPGRDGGWTASI